MTRFEDAVLDQFGRPVNGATVSVFLQGTANLATIYADDAEGYRGNPTTTDSLGRFWFYIADGKYDFQVSGTNITTYKQLDVEIADVSEIFSGDVAWKVKILNNIRFADQFAGADAGAKDAAAITDLPATGGTVDARGLEGAQTLSSTVHIGSQTKQVTLLLGNMTLTRATGAQFIVYTGSALIGSGSDDPSRAPGTYIVGNDTVAAIATGIYGGIASGYNITIKHLRINGTSSTNVGSGCVFHHGNNSLIEDVNCTNVDKAFLGTGYYNTFRQLSFAGVNRGFQAGFTDYFNHNYIQAVGGTVDGTAGTGIAYDLGPMAGGNELHIDAESVNIGVSCQGGGNTFISPWIEAANQSIVWQSGAFGNSVTGGGGPTAAPVNNSGNATNGTFMAGGTYGTQQTRFPAQEIRIQSASLAPGYPLLLGANKGIGQELAAPSNLTATPFTTGESLADGTYYCQVESQIGGGFSLPTAEVSATVSGGGGSGKVTLSWTNPHDSDYRRILCANTSGGEKYVGAVSGTVNTFDYTGQAPTGEVPTTSANAFTFDVDVWGHISAHALTLRSVLTSVLPTGTAPLVVASTTPVVNLTVQRLDSTQVYDVKRMKASGGTALVAGDFALSAGWGNTAVVSAVNGTDQGWNITVTCGGSGIAANPTVTLTFKDGTWTLAPIAISKMVGGNGMITDLTDAPTATTWVITFNGTPVTAKTYIISGIAMGR